MEIVTEAKTDQVNKLVQSELWPLVKPLEMKTASGTTVMKRDKDGSVLQAVKSKALDIVDKYSGDNKQKHTDVINSATNYMDVIKLLTNVMLFNNKLGVNEGVFTNLEFNSRVAAKNNLDVLDYHVNYKPNGEVEGYVDVADNTIQVPENYQDVASVRVKFSALVNNQMGEVNFIHPQFQLEPAPVSNRNEQQAANEYLQKFKAKYEQFFTGDHNLLDLVGFNPDINKLRQAQ